MAEQRLATRPLDRLKVMLSDAQVREQFQNALQENSNAFVASIIDLVGSDSNLQQCEAGALIRECLKAATLKLAVNRQLGFVWIIPYKIGKEQKMTPQFQLGYKGYIQLAMRTGHYKHLNAGTITSDQTILHDYVTGEIAIHGEPTGVVVGYFAHLTLDNGFRKTIYWPIERVQAHARRFSKAYEKDLSPWRTDFDAMALKTMLRQLLSKYGFLSIEMQQAMVTDVGEIEEDHRTIAEPERMDQAHPVESLPDGQQQPPAGGQQSLPEGQG